MTKGLFVSIEGVDCAGKSTLAAGLQERFPDREVHLYKFPSNGRYGEMGRALLHSEDFNADEYMMLCLLDMKDRYENHIKRDLDAGAIVIVDRYVHSTAAYQSKMLKREKAVFASSIANLAFRILGLPLPDLTLLLNLSHGSAMKRMMEKDDVDAIERGMSRNMLVSIARTYARMMGHKKYGDIVMLNGELPKDILLNDAVNCIEKKMLGFE